MEFLMDYHIVFMMMSFVMFIIAILLLFIDVTLEKAVAANVLLFFNMILNLIISLGFGALDIYSWDSSGNLVHNVTGSMYPFIYVYWIFFYMSLMLLFYCIYIYYKKPWQLYESGRNYYDQEEYYDREW